MFAGMLSAAVAVALMLAVVAATFGGILEAIIGAGSSSRSTGEFAGFTSFEWRAADGENASFSKAVALARTRVGLPYVWGAAGPAAFDCSGLVVWVYRQLGLAVPRTADRQFRWARPVNLASLQPGDLVFYEHTYPAPQAITHVGIYAGAGTVLMATSAGDFVRTVGLFDAYWGDHLAGAGRP